MRLRVIDGAPHVWWLDPTKFNQFHWRPLDDRPEDREAWEAWGNHTHCCYCAGEDDDCTVEVLPDGLYELVEEHHGVCCSNVHRVGCACPAGWPCKTLRRVGDA